MSHIATTTDAWDFLPDRTWDNYLVHCVQMMCWQLIFWAITEMCDPLSLPAESPFCSWQQHSLHGALDICSLWVPHIWIWFLTQGGRLWVLSCFKVRRRPCFVVNGLWRHDSLYMNPPYIQSATLSIYNNSILITNAMFPLLSARHGYLLSECR